jgi:hypothetical protein
MGSLEVRHKNATTSYHTAASEIKSSALNQESDKEPEPIGDADQQYETFADLYAAAKPSKDFEKVLVAAYWHQVVKGQKDFGSTLLNKDLANLGHRIININMKFDTLIETKPQLALQLKKSGSSRQARRQYKLTQAGITKVQGMIAQ